MSIAFIYAVGAPAVMIFVAIIGGFWLTARDQKEAARQKKQAES